MEQSVGLIRGMDMLSVVFCSATHRSTQSAFKRRKKKKTQTHKLSIDCQALPWQHSVFFPISLFFYLCCYKSFQGTLSLTWFCNYCLFSVQTILIAASNKVPFQLICLLLSASICPFLFLQNIPTVSLPADSSAEYSMVDTMHLVKPLR